MTPHGCTSSIKRYPIRKSRLSTVRKGNGQEGDTNCEAEYPSRQGFGEGLCCLPESRPPTNGSFPQADNWQRISTLRKSPSQHPAYVAEIPCASLPSTVIIKHTLSQPLLARREPSEPRRAGNGKLPIQNFLQSLPLSCLTNCVLSGSGGRQTAVFAARHRSSTMQRIETVCRASRSWICRSGGPCPNR